MAQPDRLPPELVAPRGRRITAIHPAGPLPHWRLTRRLWTRRARCTSSPSWPKHTALQTSTADDLRFHLELQRCEHLVNAPNTMVERPGPERPGAHHER
jgi:hypothetical protein